MSNLQDPSLWKEEVYYNGAWHKATGASIAVHNPATEEVIAHVPQVAAAEVEKAIACAQEAFAAWKKTTMRHRSAVLTKWYELMLQAKEELAYILTLEQGKTLQEARAEIDYGASFVRWFAEEAIRSYGTVLPTIKPNEVMMAEKEPIGVVAAITPWNFPSAMITRKIAPALAAGCAVVLKPSELTPLSAFALVELAYRAGLPENVLQVVTGDAPTIGRLFAESPYIRKLGFTGSTRVGSLLYQAAAPSIKRLSLELGGNAPFIMFASCDQEEAVRGLMVGKFRNTGQSCVGVNRVLIERSIASSVIPAIVEKVAKFKVGNGLDEASDFGPLIHSAAVEKCEELVKDALAKGAKVLCGGARPSHKGSFFTPTVLTDVTPEMAIFHEEIFGPIISIIEFSTEEEAVQSANQTPYGLASYFYSQDRGQIHRVKQQLDFGMVGVNVGLLSNEVVPFGGIKASGFGYEGSFKGLEEYQRLKYSCEWMKE